MSPSQRNFFRSRSFSTVVSGATDPLRLARHDAVEIRGDGSLTVAADGGPAHVLLLEMAAGSGGRGPGKWPLHFG